MAGRVSRESALLAAFKPEAFRFLRRGAQDDSLWNIRPQDDKLKKEGLTGVSPKLVQQKYPEWPSALRDQHFSVTVKIVIGKDGHVVSAHAGSRPSNAYKTAENAAREWTFQHYLVLDQPAEVETKIILNHN